MCSLLDMRLLQNKRMFSFKQVLPTLSVTLTTSESFWTWSSLSIGWVLTLLSSWRVRDRSPPTNLLLFLFSVSLWFLFTLSLFQPVQQNIAWCD